MLYLVGATLGNFGYNDLGKDTDWRIIGEVILVVFLIINMVLILNLLIAILSNTYSVLEPYSIGIYTN